MMKVPPASASTRRAYELITDTVSARGAEAASMFGMPTLKVGGKGFAGLFGDAMVFKLEGDAHASALALRGAKLFDPSGMGRPMKAWVVVPSAHASIWPELAHEALESAGAAGPKKPPAKKPAAKKPAAKKPAAKKPAAKKPAAKKPAAAAKKPAAKKPAAKKAAAKKAAR